MISSSPKYFANAPVVELALSVQFDRLPKLNAAHLGLLWREFSKAFPIVEEQSPLPSQREVFEGAVFISPSLELLRKAPSPRLWFLNRAGTELIQVQEDRFAHNWRKQGDQDEYPKYESIRGPFVDELKRFDRFLRAESLGACSPNLCETTYVDHIFTDEGFLGRGDLGRLLMFWEEGFGTPSLGQPEESGCTLRWILRDGAKGDPIGRLYVSVQPAFRKSDERPMFVMESSARGKPLGLGLEGAFAFLDFAHEKLVECFLQLTRQGIQQVWKESSR